MKIIKIFKKSIFKKIQFSSKFNFNIIKNNIKSSNFFPINK